MNSAKQSPQLAFDAQDDEQRTAASLSRLPGPGAIVNRMSQQFQLPRAEPDSQMSERPGINTGEIG